MAVPKEELAKCCSRWNPSHVSLWQRQMTTRYLLWTTITGACTLLVLLWALPHKDDQQGSDGSGPEGDESPRQLVKEALPSRRRKSEDNEDDEVQGKESELGKALPSPRSQSLATAAPSWAPWLARNTAAGAAGTGLWPSTPSRRWQAAMSPSEKRDLDMMFRQQERQVGRPARTLDINKAKQARQRNRQRKEASVAEAVVPEGSPSCDFDQEELLRLLGEVPRTSPPAASPRKSKRRPKRRRKAPAVGAEQSSQGLQVPGDEEGEEGEEEEAVETIVDDAASVPADDEDGQETVNIVGDERVEEESAEVEEEEGEEASPSSSSGGFAAVASEDASEETPTAVPEEVTRRDVGVQAGASKLHTVAWQLQDELDAQRRQPSNATNGEGRDTEIASATEATGHAESNDVGSASKTGGRTTLDGLASAWRQQSWADIADTDEEDGGSSAAILAAPKGCSNTSSPLRHASCEEATDGTEAAANVQEETDGTHGAANAHVATDDTPEPEATPEPAVEGCKTDDRWREKMQSGISQPSKARETKVSIRGKIKGQGRGWTAVRQRNDRGRRGS